MPDYAASELVMWDKISDRQLAQYKFGFSPRTTMNVLFPYWELKTHSNWEDIFDVEHYKNLEKSGHENDIRLTFWNYTMSRLDKRKYNYFSRYDRAPTVEQVVRRMEQLNTCAKIKCIFCF